MMFFNRVLAFAYDVVLLLIIAIVVLFGTHYINKEFMQLNEVNEILFMSGFGLLLYLIFFGLLPKKLDGTIGKSFTELKVVPTHGKITFGRWIFRELFLKHLIYFTGIGLFIELFFIIIKKKTIHDYYMKTKVTKNTDIIEQ